MKRQYTELEFQSFIDSNLVVNLSAGGLVIGNLHENGGIPIFRGPYLEDRTYRFDAEMEGCEFVMNAGATIKYEDQIKRINSEMAAIMQTSKFEILVKTLFNDNSTILVNSAMIEDADENKGFTSRFVLFHETQFVVNRFSSMIYYHELYRMNAEFK